MPAIRQYIGQSLENRRRIEFVSLFDNADPGVTQHLGQKDLHDLRRQSVRDSSRHFELYVQELALVIDHPLRIDLCESELFIRDK